MSGEEAARPSLHLQLLGTFEARLGDRVLTAADIRGKKPLYLLLLLALASDHRIARERLYEVLWNELNPNGAASQLYKAVYHVRQALGETGGVPDPKTWLTLDGISSALPHPAVCSPMWKRLRRRRMRR